MYRVIILLMLLSLVACKADTKPKKDDKPDELGLLQMIASSGQDTTIISDYQMDDVDPKLREEFKKSLIKIEAEHGVQWDFCTCVVKNDSINKAFQKPNLPDKEFDRLFLRSDEIEQKCQAFLVQNPDKTPDERARHEKKVRDCLKAAGIK